MLWVSQKGRPLASFAYRPTVNNVKEGGKGRPFGWYMYKYLQYHFILLRIGMVEYIPIVAKVIPKAWLKRSPIRFVRIITYEYHAKIPILCPYSNTHIPIVAK